MGIQVSASGEITMQLTRPFPASGITPKHVRNLCYQHVHSSATRTKSQPIRYSLHGEHNEEGSTPILRTSTGGRAGMGYGGAWEWREDMRGGYLRRRGTGFDVYILEDGSRWGLRN